MKEIVPEQEALKMITLNPAKQLGIDRRTTARLKSAKTPTSSLERAHPFSVYSHVRDDDD